MSLVVANRNKSDISNFLWPSWSCTGIFYIFLLKPNQQALKRKDSNVRCGSIGWRISSSSQCLVNLALMRHLLMAVEFGAGDLG